MGVYSGAVIVVGATKKQFGDNIVIRHDEEKDSDIDGIIYKGKFLSMEDAQLEWIESQWDTSDPTKIIYGFIYEITDIYTSIDVEIDLKEINRLKAEFTELTGVEAHVLLSTVMR